MAEILLPTASKQDSIKQTVESIASNFPLEVSEGTDFSQYTYLQTTVSVANSVSENFEVVNISGEGFLMSLGSTLRNWRGSFGIVVYGVVITGFCVIDGALPSLLVPFKTSLVVKTKRFGTDSTANITVGYLL